MTRAGTANELDVQNEWEENTHRYTQWEENTHTYTHSRLLTHKLIVLHLLGMIKFPVRLTAPKFELTSQRQKVSRLPAVWGTHVARLCVDQPGKVVLHVVS